MKRRGSKLLVLALIFILSLIVLALAEQDKIKGEIYQEIHEKGEANVIVREKEKSFFVFSEGKEKLYSAKVNEEELEKLKKDRDVEEISFAPQIRAFMQDTVIQVNATPSWGIILNSTNITGADETVCILDTAVNFSHPDLTGKNKTCVIDCFNKECAENCSVSDDNGHGTHVAGTAAANGKIQGVAKKADLISLKVLDENGDAHPQNGTINIRDAIQWCVQNKNAYNISVISLSLGTTTLYNDYCDSSFSSTLTKAINNATLYNISVIAATGNAGSTTGIASPACIENATSVGSVRKDDSTFSYNRNNITDLIAPGYSVNSTRGYSGSCLTNCQCYGEYMVCSGTSMAAPHVSGAFALVRQYLRLQSEETTPEEIQNILNSTGKIIRDPGSGLNFSRIDVLSAIISLDDKGPEVDLISPENSRSQFIQNSTFTCSANDPQLKNITLYIWNSSGIYNNSEFRNFQEVNGRAEFNLTEMPRGSYEWNCLAYDNNNNFSFAESNYTLTIDHTKVNLSSPENNTHTNQNQSFNCSFETDSYKKLSNATFLLWNSSENIYNETKNVSGTINSTVFTYNFTEEEKYHWNCLVYNNHSEPGFAAYNSTLIYDITPPDITLLIPENSASYTGSQQITFEFNVSEPVKNCSLLINEAEALTNSSVNSSITQQFIQTVGPGSHSWKIRCFDSAGNKKESDSRTLTVGSQQIVSSGGGGSSITTEKTYLIDEEKALGGYSQELQKRDKIIFYIEDEEHSITTKSLTSDSATFIIESEPVETTLKAGEESFFDLTGDDLNDLYLKLNSITNYKANLTIRTLKQEIPEAPEKPEPEPEEEEKVQITAFQDEKESNLNLYALISVGGVIIILVIVIVLIFKSKNEKTKAKSPRKQKISSDKRKRCK
jgi:serine protease AprX